MSTKLPPDVARRIKNSAYQAADEIDYLSTSRTDSGKFLDSLVMQADVGGVVGQYVKKAQIRHYIKDAILNRYSKDKAEEAKPTDLPPIIKRVYRLDCEESHKENKLHLFRATTPGHENEYIVVADGTMLKWETALRKSLLFIAGKPFSEKAKRIHILLTLFAGHKRVTPSDKNHLDKALAISNANAFVYGEQ